MGIHTDFDDCPKCGGDATTVTNTSGRYQLVCHDEDCCFMTITTPSGTTRPSKETWKDFAVEFGFIDADEVSIIGKKEVA